jgi:hypothetical protein
VAAVVAGLLKAPMLHLTQSTQILSSYEPLKNMQHLCANFSQNIKQHMVMINLYGAFGLMAITETVLGLHIYTSEKIQIIIKVT